MDNIFRKPTALVTTLRSKENGAILIAALIMSAALIMIGLSLAGSITARYRLVNGGVYANNAILAAEAGVEQSVEQLNQNDSFGGYPTAQTFFNNATQGKGVFTTAITASPDGTNAKIITSTGVVYQPGIATPINTRKIKVTAVGTSSAGYSVQSGPGGLILGGSANITNSQVYVNGGITLSGTSKIGTPSQPLNVYAANDVCPTGNTPGPTYPQVCTNGQQPITMAYSTNIYGTVCATGQTSTGPNPSKNIQGGSTGQGLVLGCTAPLVSMPTYNRASQIAAVTTTGSATDNAYVCNSYPFNRTWPANLKLIGNVAVGNSCNVVIKGNTYITGNLTIGGASKVTVDDSAGTTRPIVMVDGTITVNGSGSIATNSSGTGIEFVSFKSSASCSPACTSLSGNDLKTSQQLQTVSVSGAVNIPGMIFDAYWGKITLGGSGNLGSAIGQTVDMSGAGTVTFGTSLSSGARTWTISSYQQLPNR